MCLLTCVWFARPKITIQIKWCNASKLLVAHDGFGVRLADVSGWKMVLVAEHPPPPPRDGHCPVICCAQLHTVLFNDGDDASKMWYLLHWIDIFGLEIIAQLLLVRGRVAEAINMAKHPPRPPRSRTTAWS